MSILAKLTGNSPGVQGRGIRVEDIAKLQSEALARQRALQLRYAPVALRATGGDDAAAVAELAELNAATRTVEDELRSLAASHTEAIRLQALADHVARENLANSQASAVRAHLSAMKSAAKDYEAAEVARSKAWKALLNASDKAANACPVGMAWPPDWPSYQALSNLAAWHAWQIAGEVRPSARCLPGSKPRTNGKIIPLIEEVEGWSSRASEVMRQHLDSFKSAE